MIQVETGAAMEGRVSITSENGQSLMQQNIVLKNAYALLMKMKNTGEEED